MSESVSDVVAARVREVRQSRGITAPQLAEKCKDLGMPHLSAATISNIETGRRKDGKRTRTVTVDELMTLAVALGVAPVHLLVPPSRSTAPYMITPGRREMALSARTFICGMQPLDHMDRWSYFAETPEDHFFQFTAMVDEQQGRRFEYMRLTPADRDPRREIFAHPVPAPTPDWELEEGERDDGSGS